MAGAISALSTLYYALPDFLRRRPLNRRLSRISEPSATLFKPVQHQRKSAKSSPTSSPKCSTKGVSKRSACSNHFSSTKKQPPCLELANANAETDPLQSLRAQLGRLVPLRTNYSATTEKKYNRRQPPQNPCSTPHLRQSCLLSNPTSLSPLRHRI